MHLLFSCNFHNLCYNLGDIIFGVKIMDSKLRKLQLTQLEILKVFDSFCKEHNLRYSLVFGTLLGAVRHKGFIPWDDDLDVCMPRNDYNKFLDLWESDVNTKGYIIQNKDNSPLFTQSFTKIRKNNTTFIEIESEIGCYHHGVFIDVFPVDRIPEKIVLQKAYQWNALRYLLLTREYIDTNSNFVIKFISSIILKSTPISRRTSIRHKFCQKIEKYNNDSSLSCVIINTVFGIKTFYSPTLFDNLVYIEFENNQFMCFSDWDNHLKLHYGDYMKLPPESERDWRHHPIVLDFNHSYEELSN